jgi:lipopolysaccharide heptosyltransferase I
VKALIVRLSALGDIVHAVPMAVALRRAQPEARIDWLVDRRHAGVLDLFPVADRVIAVDPSGPWRATVGVVRALRASGYDVVFDAQGLLKSAVLARFAGGRRTIGFAREALREPPAVRFYTETIAPDQDQHVARWNLRLLRAIGVEDDRIEMPAPRVASSVADDVAAAVGTRYGIVNPGAGWPNKQWPPDRLGAVAAAVQQSRGLPWVVVWGPGEEALARRVEEASGGAAMLAPATTLADLMALVQRAAVVVAGDTGPIHLAAAAGTPVVGVYGPTNPARNGPWSPEDVCVSRFAACRCHHKRRCTAPAWCLGDVSVGEVVAAVERRLP